MHFSGHHQSAVVPEIGASRNDRKVRASVLIFTIARRVARTATATMKGAAERDRARIAWRDQ
jgi:hypothetical protein